MDQTSIFSSLNFKPGTYKDQNLYQGPNGYYFSIVETVEYIIIRIQSQEWEKSDDRLKIFKIGSEEKIEEIVYHAVRTFLKRGMSLFQPEIIYREIKKHLKEVDIEKMTDQEIMNVCLLYDACVRAGGMSFLICDECKRILDALLTE